MSHLPLAFRCARAPVITIIGLGLHGRTTLWIINTPGNIHKSALLLQQDRLTYFCWKTPWDHTHTHTHTKVELKVEFRYIILISLTKKKKAHKQNLLVLHPVGWKCENFLALWGFRLKSLNESLGPHRICARGAPQKSLRTSVDLKCLSFAKFVCLLNILVSLIIPLATNNTAELSAPFK